MNSEKKFQKNIELWSKTCPKQAVLLPYTNCKHLISCFTQEGEPNLKREEGNHSYFLHSQNGALKEAEEWFASLSLREVPLLCIYGVGLGYYYDILKPWLKKDRKRRLVFFEDDLAIIRKLLETERGTSLLQDRQVRLLYFQNFKNDELVFETFYWNFAMNRMAVSVLPAYLENKNEFYKELRHKIAYDAAVKNALVEEYMKYGVSFYINFYQNMLCLTDSYLGNQFFNKFTKVPAIICGAGPSLAKNISLLGGLLDKALIFAGGSALNVLNAAGIQPHFGAGIDPNPMQFSRLSSNQAYEVPFFYRNRLYHDAFRMIHGPRLYITGSGGYGTSEFFERKLKIPEGEDLDEGHNVVNFCVEVANAMGCDPIIFVGMDLAFTGMREYAPGVIENADVKQEAILNIEDEDAKAILKEDVEGKPTYTLWKWIAEAEWIGDYAKQHPSITMINCTEGGLGFPGVSNRSLMEVSKEYLRRAYEFKNRIHGEIQNSAMPSFAHAKVAKIMKELKKSLERSISCFQLLLEDAENTIHKLKDSKDAKGTLPQSGVAVLAETELAEEPAYIYILSVFNEVYTRILSRELHDIYIRRFSEKQRQIKKIELSIKKFAFLRDVSQINKELILHAFQQKKIQKNGEKISVKIPFLGQEYSARQEHFIRQFNAKAQRRKGAKKQRSKKLQKSALLFYRKLQTKIFQPVLIPVIRQEGLELTEGHVLRVFFDSQWQMYECYAEKEGIPDGQNILLYPSGSTKEEVFYRQGKLHGPATFWSQTRIVLAKSWFLNGLQEGKSYWYYPSGRLYSIQRYKNSQWHGRQEFYYENGALKTLMYYNRGRLIKEPILLRCDGTVDRVI